MTLEEKLDGAFTELRIDRKNQKSIKNYLNILKAKDYATYAHSIRVGLLGARIAKHLGMSQKALLFAGTLHDLGKIMVEPEVLKKTEKFGEKDMEVMKKHPEYSYDILKEIHPFSAEIAVRHHEYQENSYPSKLPESKIEFSWATKFKIDKYSEILAYADFYDATTRDDGKFGNFPLTNDEVKSIMQEEYPLHRYLIENLFAKGILGEQKTK